MTCSKQRSHRMQICLCVVAVRGESHNKQLWLFKNQIKGNVFKNEQLSDILPCLVHNKVVALEGAGDNSVFTL